MVQIEFKKKVKFEQGIKQVTIRDMAIFKNALYCANMGMYQDQIEKVVIVKGKPVEIEVSFKNG